MTASLVIKDVTEEDLSEQYICKLESDHQNSEYVNVTLILKGIFIIYIIINWQVKSKWPLSSLISVYNFIPPFLSKQLGPHTWPWLCALSASWRWWSWHQLCMWSLKLTSLFSSETLLAVIAAPQVRWCSYCLVLMLMIQCDNCVFLSRWKKLRRLFDVLWEQHRRRNKY